MVERWTEKNPGIPPKKTTEHMLKIAASDTGKHAYEYIQSKIIKHDECDPGTCCCGGGGGKR